MQLTLERVKHAEQYTQRSVKGNECILYGVCNGSQVSV